MVTSPVLSVRQLIDSTVVEVVSKAITVDAAAKMGVLSSCSLPEVVHVLTDVPHVKAVVHKDDFLIWSQVNNLGRDICDGGLTRNKVSRSHEQVIVMAKNSMLKDIITSRPPTLTKDLGLMG